MKLQFDANQQFQLDAISAVTNLFDGQVKNNSDFSILSIQNFTDQLAAAIDVLGFNNKLVITPEQLKANTRKVQIHNDIEIVNQDDELESWDILDSISNKNRPCYQFSVEMETGTGKTYVYLRTIYELSQLYGFQKFVIVVPSVAIREGVLKNIEITKDHLSALYNNMPCEHFVFDPNKINRIRSFATSDKLQIMIINIDSFRKNLSDDDQSNIKNDNSKKNRSNVIYKENDKLGGRKPIEFIQVTSPIVIIDEPQSVDNTPRAQEAIRALNPLLILRYSATHRNTYNLIYKLDPIRAYELGLVKQIVVASATTSNWANEAYVSLEKVDNKNGIKATVNIQAQADSEIKIKSVNIKVGDDLFYKSGERECYRNSFIISEIHAEPGNEYVKFSGGIELKLGKEIGDLSAELWKVQIRHTVIKHLDREVQLQSQGIKVLSLFFIDKVANYRYYDESNNPVKGKFAVMIEEVLHDLKNDPKYKSLTWLNEDVTRLHNGYFSTDKKGVLKDTKGDTLADDDAYKLIMQDKERLLSIEEPLRFIFSHSALREGWDNPNVFQICTLNETKSTIKKRQEIGRGLRLPVNQNGQRVFDKSLNRLYVIANESYDEFAKTLQKEYEEDCGVTFGKVSITRLAKISYELDGQVKELGSAGAKEIREALVKQGILNENNYITSKYIPQKTILELPSQYMVISNDVKDILTNHMLENHIKQDKAEVVNHLKKEIIIKPEFTELFDKIKSRTTYRIEFSTDELVNNVVNAVKQMPPITSVKVNIEAGLLTLDSGGIETSRLSSVSEEISHYTSYNIPDILNYLQNHTDLTRSTLVRILIESARLKEFLINPQLFMDNVAKIIKVELNKLLVPGIKYEPISKNNQGFVPVLEHSDCLIL